MNAQRWQQVRALFDEWVELPPDVRRARMSACAAEDAQLAAEVGRMLDADAARDTARFEALALHAADAVVARGDDSGRQIGPWRLLRTLGSGGMGTVYLGERQTPTFTQQAAVKLLRVGWNGSEARRRFEAEQRVLASLQHPNIAHLIDGGIDSDGTPYLALEFVDGLPLNEHAAKAELTASARVRLFLAVCAAVEHAHQHLVVHRDLKPGNILVNREGAIKLLDFGIAKLLDEDGQTALTSTGVRLYTPGYAAPEQLRGEPVSTATDVYALGVVLYELLTGVLPFEVASASAADWERVVLTQEPAPPSRHSRRTRVGQAPQAAWPSGWAGDIDAIVLKAIRREPNLRYSTVAELRGDLIALLDGRPVGARRGSRRYRWNKLVRRHALALGLGSVAALALIVGSGVSLWQASEAQAARERAEARRDEARAAAQRAEATVNFLTGVFAAANPGNDLGPEPTARDLLRAGEKRIAEDDQLDSLTRASVQQAIAHSHMGLNDIDASERLLLAARASAVDSGNLKAEVNAILSLAIVANRRGLQNDAIAHYEAADQLLRTRNNDDKLLQAYVDRLMAMELINVDRVEDALARISRAHAVASAELTPLAPEVTGTLSVYMAALQLNGRGPEALTYTTPSHEALAAAADTPPAQRISVASTHASALRLAGKLDAAMTVAQQVLNMRVELYGADNYRVSGDLQLIGGIQRDLQRFDDSAQTLERAVAIRRATEPATHPSLLVAEVSAARSWILARRADRARPLLESALAGYLQRGEYDQSGGMSARWWMVNLLLLESRDADARRALSELDIDKLDPKARTEALALQARLVASTSD